ncbi:MAG: CBS domain-containing protein [Nitrosotalea sp.]
MTVQLNENSNDLQRKLDLIDSLYLYSDLSVETIAKTVDMDVKEVQKIIDNLIRKDAVEALYEQSNVSIEHVMKKDVASLDCSKTALDAATLMIEKGVGCVVVTAQGKPFGMVTERDILCEMTFSDKMPADLSLEVIASRPLIHVSPVETVGNVADLMMKNNIRRVPVVEDGKLVGMVVVKDLAMLLSSTKRPGLAKAILEAISRSRNI